MSENMDKKKCTPCSMGTPPLKGDKLKIYVAELPTGWKIIDEHHLEKEFSFKNFREALNFTNKVGEIAEEEGHHPDLLLRWGKVKLTFWTHKINGLSENDFIMAAKCDRKFSL